MNELAKAIHAHLKEKGKELDTSPMAVVVIPCKGGEQLEIPTLFVENASSVSDIGQSSWLVESIVNGKFDGWFTAPELGHSGWLTEDPNVAKKYTQAEARAVAHALTYFHSPFNYSNWIATEHRWMDETPLPAGADPQNLEDKN